MENKLTQEYKDDLYEKVMEKKRKRTLRRKKMLSVFIVFVSIIGVTTFGFSMLEKEDYKNFFRSKTENKIINDEYEYFDDLGIKLEFVNVDEDYLTVGVNVRYEDIIDYSVDLENIIVMDLNKNIILEDSNYQYASQYNVKEKMNDKKINSSSEIVYIVKYKLKESIKLDNIKICIKNLMLEKYDKDVIEFNIEKVISIED